jgi:hypothetical protein
MIRDLREAARAKRSDILEAGTQSQIDATFETLVQYNAQRYRVPALRGAG